MPFITVYDDDPETGPPRYITVEVFPMTGPAAPYCLLGPQHTQKVHPLDALRRIGGDADPTSRRRQSTAEARRRYVDRCRVPGRPCSACHTREAGPGRATCSVCRSTASRRATCACGRPLTARANESCWVCRARGAKRSGWVEAQAQ